MLYMVPWPGAWALQILEATDHAELTAEIAAHAVNRVALDGDRISRVIQAPSVLTVEHDPVRGDVYLFAHRSVRADEAVTLYLGSERGLTYRLALTVADRDPAQILIRNAAVAVASDERGGSRTFGTKVDVRIGELVALIRAVARREPLPGYTIVAAPTAVGDPYDPAAIEAWHGSRWTARVLAHGNLLAQRGYAIQDAAALAEAVGPGVAAAWVSEPGQLTDGGRLAVVVEATPGEDR